MFEIITILICIGHCGELRTSVFQCYGFSVETLYRHSIVGNMLHANRRDTFGLGSNPSVRTLLSVLRANEMSTGDETFCPAYRFEKFLSRYTVTSRSHSTGAPFCWK